MLCVNISVSVKRLSAGFLFIINTNICLSFKSLFLDDIVPDSFCQSILAISCNITICFPPVVEISLKLDLDGVQVTIVTVPGVVPASHIRKYNQLLKLSHANSTVQTSGR